MFALDVLEAEGGRFRFNGSGGFSKMRITNVECRIMKFNKVFPYFDIRHSLFDILRFKTKCAQVNNIGGSGFSS